MVGMQPPRLTKDSRSASKVEMRPLRLTKNMRSASDVLTKDARSASKFGNTTFAFARSVSEVLSSIIFRQPTIYLISSYLPSSASINRIK